MKEMIEERRDSGAGGTDRFDLFSALLDANAEWGISESAMLSDSELIGKEN